MQNGNFCSFEHSGDGCLAGRGPCVIFPFWHPIAKCYMKQSLQLRIPTPCSEDWTRMQPAEIGRYCQSCCKTVVDFTEMSDAEIIRLLSQAGPHICGRLMPDQLNRTLMPAPVQKNGRSGWAWVLASLLMVAKGSDNGRPVKAGKVEMRAPAAGTDSSFVTTGVIWRVGGVRPVIREEEDSSATRGRLETRVVPDTNRVEMGRPMVVEADSVRPPGDTLPAVSPATMRSKESTAFAGGVVVGVKIDSAIDILTDTMRQIVSDTLAALGWSPAPALNIYPNPVSRGGAMQLAWKTQPGQYQLTLMNTRGQLIAERILDVGGAGQVDSWEIPASLAAAIYILQVARAGGASATTGGSGMAAAAGAAGIAGTAGPAAVCTLEIMVR